MRRWSRIVIDSVDRILPLELSFDRHELTSSEPPAKIHDMSQDPVLREEFHELLKRQGVQHLLDRRPTVTTQNLAEEMRANANGPDFDARFYEQLLRSPVGPVNQDGILQHPSNGFSNRLTR